MNIPDLLAPGLGAAFPGMNLPPVNPGQMGEYQSLIEDQKQQNKMNQMFTHLSNNEKNKHDSIMAILRNSKVS